MALVELLIKIGDSGEGTGAWLDGMIVDARRPGIWITAAQINQYVQNGTVPAAIQALRRTEKKQLKREMDRLIFFTTHTAQEAAAITGMGLKWAINEVAQYTGWANKIVEHGGWDTVWKYQEMKVFGIIRADISVDDIREALTEDIDDTQHPAALPIQQFRRGWRLAYENVAPAGLIADWQNPDVLRLPVRSGPGVPVGIGLFEEIV